LLDVILLIALAALFTILPLRSPYAPPCTFAVVEGPGWIDDAGYAAAQSPVVRGGRTPYLQASRRRGLRGWTTGARVRGSQRRSGGSSDRAANPTEPSIPPQGI